MSLQLEIEKLIEDSQANVSVVVMDHKGQPLVSINANRIYHAASTIKVPILYTLISLWDKGILNLEDSLALTEDEKVEGCGILKLMTAGSKYTFRELMHLMICISDNTATNMLIEALGIDLVNSEMKSLGLKQTHLARKLMITGTSTYSKTCASDLATLFSQFSASGQLGNQAIQLGKEILLKQQLNDRLNRDWYLCGNCMAWLGNQNRCPACGTWAGTTDPSPIPFYHKTGEIVGLVHDAGLLSIKNQLISIAVLSDSHENNLEGATLLSAIGNKIVQTLL